jgi:hypothetical protein
MYHMTQPIDFSKVQEFVNKFESAYPHLYLQITLDEVAGWLSQSHWKQYSDNLAGGVITQQIYDRFMLGMFSDWVMANQFVEVAM